MGADPSPQTPTGSTYFALENEALKARVYELQALCARAADALEFWINDWAATEDEYDAIAKSDSALITELRKAAE